MSLKHFIRDVAILISYYSIYIWQRHCLGRVIVFHEIKDEMRFKEKMMWIHEHYKIVTLDELLSKTLNTPCLAITFDDGYSCWYEKAAPILKELNIPATFFVCSGFIGLKGEQLRWFCRERLKRQQILKPLTKNQLIDLANNPLFEIGSHTKTHIDLGKNIDSNILITEIYDDKKQLEDWIGRPVRWFAYPFGRKSNISSQARNCIAQAGFEGAFTLIPGFVYPSMDKLLINRDSLDLTDSHVFWSARLNGAYDRLYYFKERYFLKIYESVANLFLKCSKFRLNKID